MALKPPRSMKEGCHCGLRSAVPVRR